MAHLVPVPFASLARRMFRELEERQSIFDLPAHRFVLGSADTDFAVSFLGHRAATPFGPAAGPHTQLAQNIVKSWLAGGRVIELKTVQVNDALTLPRPCIDMQTVGYNVEWSQELPLEASLEEYVKAAMLIRMLVASGRLALAPRFDRTVFDMSVGYDLAGIRSERVRGFIRGMRDARPVIDRLRAQIPPELASYRDAGFEPELSGTLTLSTFHGCPPAEIERIARFLLEELELDCVVKLNPTLLGREDVDALLREALGYRDLVVPRAAFDRDTTWEQAVDFCGRLADGAAAAGRRFGVKFTNTLIVENHRTFFPPSEREMYLSGPPLHVLAMHLVRRLRRTFADRIPISFSGGIDRHNFPDAVALGLVPVTVCTDLLKPNGYARAAGYFEELKRRMDAVGAHGIFEFIVRTAEGDTALAPTPESLAAATLRNTERYVATLAADPRYGAERNLRVPRKVGSRLSLFDCLTCDKCVPVCPNDANFDVPLERVRPRQFVNFADLCNDCGNCDVFCPEDGGPYLVKPRLFVSRQRWEADAPRDAVLVEPAKITGRFSGVVHEVPVAAGSGDTGLDASLRRLHAALFAPGTVNYVNTYW